MTQLAIISIMKQIMKIPFFCIFRIIAVYVFGPAGESSRKVHELVNGIKSYQPDQILDLSVQDGIQTALKIEGKIIVVSFTLSRAEQNAVDALGGFEGDKKFFRLKPFILCFLIIFSVNLCIYLY